MNDPVYLLFLLGVGWLATHELDAIANHEWRILPLTSPFDDLTGYRVFVAAHVPLFALIIAFAPVRAFQIGFDIFLIVHVGLHWLFRNHPRYEFEGWFSTLWIVGAGVIGALHLGMLLFAG